MNKRIKKAITDLKDSPLFALTLCGKELAHSNFWKWLMDLKENEKHPFMDVFIKDFNKKYQFDHVEREEGNRDLTIYCIENGKEKSFIIENKLKSIPTLEQLTKYQKKFHNKKSPFSGGILTGIEDTLDSKPDGWVFLSYADISKYIQRINKKFKNPYQKVIMDYCNDLNNIVEILTTLSAESQDRYIWAAPDELKDIRMADIYLKQEEAKFGNFLRKKIEQTQELWSKNWGKPIVETAFNRTKPTISVIYRDNDNSEEDNDGRGRFGIQIEGLEFRYYGGPSYPESPLMKDFPTSKKDRDNSEVLKTTAIFKTFSACKWFLPYDHQDKKYRGEKTSMSKLFRAYKTNEYCHAHQYYYIDASNPDNITYDALWEIILNALSEAKGIIDSGIITF